MGVPWRQSQGVGGNVESRVEVMRILGLNDVLEPRLFLRQCVEICIRLRVVCVDFFKPSEGVDGFLNPFFNVTPHILVAIELRLLRQVTNLDAGLGARLT